MNRIPFKGIITKNGNYLNDEIQWKLQQAFPQSNEIILEFKNLDTDVSLAKIKEYDKACKNLNAMILGFNNIVERGEEFARQFIGE